MNVFTKIRNAKINVSTDIFQRAVKSMFKGSRPWRILLITITIVYGITLFNVIESERSIRRKMNAGNAVQFSRAKVEINLLRMKNTWLREELGASIKRNREDLHSYISHRFRSIPNELSLMIAERTNILSIKHKIPFSLIVGVMEVESSFNPFAKSKVGAIGLMQVRPEIWAKELGIGDTKSLYDIETNIEAGTIILVYYLEKNKGNVEEALKDYCGTTCNRYPNKVFAAMGRFETFRNIFDSKEETEQEWR